MKALVLCGGIPQIELINNLKRRGITTLLADMNENVGGRKYADFFFPISVLDVEAVKKLAIDEKVDFVITVCADQVLQVMAQVSEELGLPCYIDYATAENVSKKTYMKRIFAENGIPTSKYLIMDEIDDKKVEELRYPLIVKPVDSYSSRGVRKVLCREELYEAFADAKKISRTHNAIVEEFVSGNELTVDVYVSEGIAHVLCVSRLDKIPGSDRFVICRTCSPADVSADIERKVCKAAQGIADAFGIKNAPMLIQLITDGENISVVEFCARTGGGDKFRLIEKVSGFDVVDAVVELTLGNKPKVSDRRPPSRMIVNEFLYCNEGIFDHLEGFDKLLEEGVITEYYQLKSQGARMSAISSSGDRVAYFTIETENADELKAKHREANQRIRAVDVEGRDILRHDIVGGYLGE